MKKFRFDVITLAQLAVLWILLLSVFPMMSWTEITWTLAFLVGVTTMLVSSAVADLQGDRAHHHQRLERANEPTNIEHAEAHAEDAKRWKRKTIKSIVIGLGAGVTTLLLLLIFRCFH